MSTHSQRALYASMSLLALVLIDPSIADDKEPSPQELEFFEQKIRPVLVKHCYKCHSDKTEEPGGGLLLDTRENARSGGESGPAVVPGELEDSLIISAIEYVDFEMPPDKQLPKDVVRDFRRWIEIGAPDPRETESPETESPETEPSETEPSETESPEDKVTSADLSSVQPVTSPQPPRVDGALRRRTDTEPIADEC